MEDEKKEVKKAQAYTLKPINIAWLTKKALDESTPEKRMSASALLDQIVDEAREKSGEQVSPSKHKASTRAFETVAA